MLVCVPVCTVYVTVGSLRFFFFFEIRSLSGLEMNKQARLAVQ